MKDRISRLVCFAAILAMVLCMAPVAMWGQVSGNQGSIVVTAQDDSGAVIPNADIELVELRSNSARKAQTDDKGLYTFVNLNIGTYRLTLSHAGYQTKIYDGVLVEAANTTTIAAAMSVGKVTETVRVTAEATPVLQTSSNQLGTTINTKEIENLPLSGRSVSQLSSLVAGYNGTFNGVQSSNQGNNIDGMISSNSRMKFGGNSSPAVSPRIESFEQMSVVSDGLSLGNGFGQATTQVNFVSRRGSNQFHGRAYYDFRSDGLNANSWSNNAAVNSAGQWAPLRRGKLILHDFGVSVGGPILHDKLFFFGTFATSRQPSTTATSNSVFTSAAQNGLYTYNGTDGVLHTVNVFQLGATIDPTHSKLDGTVSNELSAINGAVNGFSTVAINNEYNIRTLPFNAPGGQFIYYPVARVDYNMNDKIRMYLSWLMTRTTTAGAQTPPFPGAAFANQVGAQFTKNYTASYGLDYIISPSIVNQFKFGFLYTYTMSMNGAPANYTKAPTVQWSYSGASMSGQNFSLPIGNMYPLFSLTDNITYQRGGHTFNFGFQGYREQDHYYNGPVGFNILPTGISSGDPIVNAFTYTGTNPTLPAANSTIQSSAEQMYATLTGRLANVNGQFAYSPQKNNYFNGYASYNLDEVDLATGVWFQDSWKVLPTLTVNYGLRWDFTTPSHDITAQYTSATLPNIYGPTAVGDLFKPGVLAGVTNPVHQVNPRPINGWYKSPQPMLGIAWNPKVSEGGFLRKLLGEQGTVIRANFALRNFTEPYQYFWDGATDYGSFYYQSWGLTANTTGTTGTFTPGSLHINDVATGASNVPAYSYTPTAFQKTTPESTFTFVGGGGSPGITGLKSNIRQPYTESWTLGIQRQLGRTQVLEIRYNGSRTVHHWVELNLNETNVVENGFTDEFKRAQANLRTVNGKQTFSDVGQSVQTPLIDAAFGGAGTANFTSTQFIGYLTNGQAGSFANQLAGNSNSTPTYFCNLVGASFGPCKTNAGFTGAGYGTPINFFQANPYNGGRASNYITDAGYSNYNALQVELRQATWHGLQYQFNYTWSHTLGFASNNGYDASIPMFYTLRNFKLAYQPQLFDIAQVTHAYGTYDLPFGKGRAFLNQNALLDRVIGGWSLGTVITFQTGAPFRLTGGYATFNSNDGGIRLNGTTSSALQKSVGVRRPPPGKTTATLIDPKFIASTGLANTSYLAPNTTPGTIGQVINLHAPHTFSQNLAITKTVPIKDQYRFSIQGEFINVWNHPYWGVTGASTQSLISTTFAQAGLTSTARVIEMRANFEF